MIKTILTFYSVMLDYASVVWEPHLKKDKLLLESVQLSYRPLVLANNGKKAVHHSINDLGVGTKLIYFLSPCLFCTASKP